MSFWELIWVFAVGVCAVSTTTTNLLSIAVSTLLTRYIYVVTLCVISVHDVRKRALRNKDVLHYPGFIAIGQRYADIMLLL